MSRPAPHPRELRAAVKAYNKHGSYEAAAQVLNIPTSTLKYRVKAAKSTLNAEVKGQNVARDKRIKLLEGELSKHVKDNTKLMAQIDTLSEQLTKARKSKVKPIKPSLSKPPKGNFHRFFITDTHGCFANEAALAACLADVKRVNPREIVLGGDHLDCGGFLAAHHTMCYVAQSTYTFEDDLNAANLFLDELQKAAPNAKIYYLEGNHEQRIEKWIMTTMVRGGNPTDAAYLHNVFNPEIVLHLKERGISYHRTSQQFPGVTMGGCIKLGKCYFVHGIATAKHSAAATVDKIGGNVCFGHTHREDTFTRRPVATGVIRAFNPGCLCDLMPMYGHGKPNDWSHGYGLQSVHQDGTFLHVNVPIIDGKSYLSHLLS